MQHNEKTRQALDLADWIACMDLYGPQVVRCAGDRIVVKRYQCPHCGSGLPSEDCKKPRKGAAS